jgi:hypothetical protein
MGTGQTIDAFFVLLDLLECDAQQVSNIRLRLAAGDTSSLKPCTNRYVEVCCSTRHLAPPVETGEITAIST